jgi:hypothetical protein
MLFKLYEVYAAINDVAAPSEKMLPDLMLCNCLSCTHITRENIPLNCKKKLPCNLILLNLGF